MRPAYLDDDSCLTHGEGVTRSTAPGTSLWSFEIKPANGKSIRGTIRALGPRQARQFLEARHPGATVLTVSRRPAR